MLLGPLLAKSNVTGATSWSSSKTGVERAGGLRVREAEQQYSMTGNGGNFSTLAVHVDAVIATLAEELSIVLFQMPDQIDPLHEI